MKPDQMYSIANMLSSEQISFLSALLNMKYMDGNLHGAYQRWSEIGKIEKGCICQQGVLSL